LVSIVPIYLHGGASLTIHQPGYEPLFRLDSEHAYKSLSYSRHYAREVLELFLDHDRLPEGALEKSGATYVEWPAEAGKELLIKKYSDLCELSVREKK
jgi:hypothetical protein